MTLALLSSWSTTAHAWTDAAVRSASARVTLSDDASSVHVDLTAQLRIDGGWLEAFELDGLDEGLVLDPDVPPTFELWERPRWAPASEDESASEPPRIIPEPVFVASLAPRVSVHGSRVAMSFRRRGAPRAGLYRARVVYDAPAADYVVRSSEHAELRWTLPAWRNGLDDVQVVLVLPPGSTAVPLSEDEDASIDVSESESAEGEILSFTRVHLPRTQSWTIRAELPASFRLPAREDGASPVRDVERAVDAERSPLAAAVFVLLLAILVVTKASLRARDAVELEATTGALVPMPQLVRTVVVLALLLGSWASLLAAPELFALGPVLIGLVGLHGAGRIRPEARRLGSFRSAWGRATERAAQADRSQRARSWLEPTRGGVVVALALTLAVACAHHFDALSAPSAFVIGAAFVATLLSGRALVSPHATLGALVRRARTLSVDLDLGIALAPLLHLDIRGRVQSGRLRVVLAAPLDGLVRSDLILDGDAMRLLLVARRGSAAERSLVVFAAEQALELEASEGERVVVACDPGHLCAAARALSEQSDVEALRRAS